MTRYDDIPEAFRRAMEEAGWRGGGDEGGRQPDSAHPVDPWWTNRWLWLLALAILLIASLNWIVTTYTDWLWFDALGYRNVWLKQWGAQVITFVVFFVVAAVVLLANWHVARRRALRPAEAGIQVLNLPGVNWLITGVALFFAFIMGQAAASNWEVFLRYVYRAPAGVDEPIFGRDVSFYLFELPVYRFVQGWIMPLLVITLLGIAAIYVLNNLPSIRRNLPIQTLPAPLRPHAAILLFFFFLFWSAGHWISISELLYSGRGVAFGASYVDLNAVLPALWIQLGLMILVALGAGFLAFRPEPRPLLIAGALWFVASVGLGGIYPGLLQRYAVDPNELARETPFIENNISFTRMGFDLDELETFPFDPDDDVTPQDLADNDAALRNIRLWDYRPLHQTYSQLQELRTYYEFNDIDIDRYNVDGESRQVMLAAREINKALVESRWVNQRLEYTHGYGLVMNPVDEITSQGRPVFYIQDLPPQSTIDVTVDRPEIYYGEITRDVVYVNTGLEEFDYPAGDRNVYSHYQGEGGVAISSWLRRLAFTLRFGETNLILSQYINPDSRAMFHRQIQERVQRIAPFLWQDSDPYIVTVDGRLVWMLDTYTISRDFPYSQPMDPAALNIQSLPTGLNYIRNAVKVTIDAYSGEVNFYVTDPDDPIIQTYANAFPDLFHAFDEMPVSLQEHIRYPEDLFRVQTEQFRKYHMVDVQVFFNNEDLWAVPMEIFDQGTQPMEPYYVTFALPGEEEVEFLLIQPYTPAGRDNMIAWIAARSDPGVYGELRAYELPKQELVFGPLQVESRIDQETLISEQFSLWSQLGSNVIRGNLIVVPINDSFLYVEPIYLESEISAIPELKRVIVATGQHIVMRETLDQALAALLEEAPPVSEVVADVPEAEEQPDETDETEVEAPEETIEVQASVQELIHSANEHLEAAEEAQRAGDWAAYGQEQQALRESLEQLLELTGGQLPAESSEP